MRDQKADGVGRILVVEDESSILTALTLLLEMEGYQVAEATNGRQGLELLAGFVPDLIVTDYMMPYMNGLEMVRHLRQDPVYADVPVILVSAALPATRRGQSWSTSACPSRSPSTSCWLPSSASWPPAEAGAPQAFHPFTGSRL